MEKLNFITRQLARAEKKRFENYVITRIWHRLDDMTIKFVTQQYVIRPDGRALTDMYFPQFKIHIEVDERHHLNQQEKDQLRDSDIINATNHDLRHIDTTIGIDKLNERIEEVINIIREAKLSLHNFIPWNIESEQNPQTYINNGFIDIADNVAFTHSYLAANCFGHNYKGFQRGATQHPNENNKLIWFPKLYKNDDWDNSISDDGKKIFELCENLAKNKSHVDNIVNGKIHNRIVFARVKSPLGDVMYRFKGEFKLDLKTSNSEDGLVWQKIENRVKTYGIIQ